VSDDGLTIISVEPTMTKTSPSERQQRGGIV